MIARVNGRKGMHDSAEASRAGPEQREPQSATEGPSNPCISLEQSRLASVRPAVTELSVVVPLWNEELNVMPLMQQVFSAFQNETTPLELILVDDASTDGTWDQILKAQGADERIRAVRLVR